MKRIAALVADLAQDLAALGGAGLIVAGVAMAYRPAGLITAGVFLLAAAWRSAQRTAAAEAAKGEA